MLNLLTEGVREEQKYSFHRTLCFQRLILKEKLTISYLLDILLILLKFFLHFQLRQTNLKQFAKCYSCNSFVRYFHAIWSVESILGNNSRTKTLPGMEFEMESQVSYSFSFQRVLRKIKCQTWKKNTKCPILRSFLPKYLSKSDFCTKLCYVSS